MLDQIGGALRPVARAVRASHERWDGNGYPDGLAGEDDPAARPDRGLLRRPARDDQRQAVPPGDAGRRRRWRSCDRTAGTQFDPGVVDGRSSASAPGRPRGSTRRRVRRAAAGPGLRVPSLLGELEAHAEHIAAVAEATRELARANDAEEVRQAICHAALRVSGAAAAVLVEPAGDGWLAETGTGGEPVPGPTRAPGAVGLEHPRFVPDIGGRGRRRRRARARRGRWLGAPRADTARRRAPGGRGGHLARADPSGCPAPSRR